MQGVSDFIEGYHHAAVVFGPPPCRFCGGSSHSTTGDYPYWVWCCDEAKEESDMAEDDRAISRLRSRGYQVKKIV